MDTQRLILFIIFSFSILMLWEAWQKEQRPPQPAATAPAPQQAGSPPQPSPQLAASPAPAAPGAAAIPSAAAAPEASEKILVKTDVMVVEVDTLGGELKRVELLRHQDREDKNKRFVLLETGLNRTYVAQSGLVGEGLPNHKTRFAAAPGARELAAGAEKLELKLSAAGQGVEVIKTYTFRRGSYLVDVGFEVKNAGAASLQPYAYFQLVRDGNPPTGDSKMVPTYTGAAYFTEKDKFQKVEYSAIEKGKATVPQNTDNGWIAMLQHYFVAAWLPQGKTAREFFARRVGENLYAVGVIVPAGAIDPGKAGTVTVPLYVGPQEQDNLAKLAPGLDLVVDYGWLTVIATPLFWVLGLFYKWAGNWGVAIILLTVLIKAAFYPLSAASYRSMAKMKVIAPKLQKIKEQYGEDRQRLHQAMMDLYKTEKINPLGGCLPIAIQIPVFIALYWVLLASVELRHAPFYFWILDLSAPDPYYVLPVVMGITMVIQTRLNPTPPDPIQAKVMQIMPIAFSVMFFFFPAGLVLYWLVNNVLSIAQQWQITRALERAKPAHGKR
ncbi:MAG: membrane protein insertase YidC [Betaproteobacteria bacterium]|nr:membrane protein insertase YidC [Betaproteobacteria bacterium]